MRHLHIDKTLADYSAHIGNEVVAQLGMVQKQNETIIAVKKQEAFSWDKAQNNGTYSHTYYLT